MERWQKELMKKKIHISLRLSESDYELLSIFMYHHKVENRSEVIRELIQALINYIPLASPPREQIEENQNL